MVLKGQRLPQAPRACPAAQGARAGPRRPPCPTPAPEGQRAPLHGARRMPPPPPPPPAGRLATPRSLLLWAQDRPSRYPAVQCLPCPPRGLPAQQGFSAQQFVSPPRPPALPQRPPPGCPAPARLHPPVSGPCPPWRLPHCLLAGAAHTQMETVGTELLCQGLRCSGAGRPAGFRAIGQW